jgi:hypothetical protein
MVMYSPDVNIGKTISELEEKKKNLFEQKLLIEHQIAVIDQTIKSFQYLGNPHATMPLPRNLNELGLQDAVRAVFKHAYPLARTPVEIRNTLMDSGVMPRSAKNLLISIHTVIGRIRKELEAVPQEQGKSAYRWKENIRTWMDRQE